MWWFLWWLMWPQMTKLSSIKSDVLFITSFLQELNVILAINYYWPNKAIAVHSSNLNGAFKFVVCSFMLQCTLYHFNFVHQCSIHCYIINSNGSSEVPVEKIVWLSNELQQGFDFKLFVGGNGIWKGADCFSGKVNVFPNAGSQRW